MFMNLETLIFYLLSALTVFAALRVITSRNPVHAALFLVLAFFSTAGIWLLLEAEFLALTLVLVYVGAVMVLFLFVVMMLDINLERLRVGFWKWFPFAVVLAVVLLVEMVMVLGSSQTTATPRNWAG
jgi:NADH-quinone oxidoreductase subunit J